MTTRAQRLLATAASDPRQAERVAELVRRGQATLGAYPDRADWAPLIASALPFADTLYLALRPRPALLGRHAPPARARSIAAYAAATAQAAQARARWLGEDAARACGRTIPQGRYRETACTVAGGARVAPRGMGARPAAAALGRPGRAG